MSSSTTGLLPKRGRISVKAEGERVRSGQICGMRGVGENEGEVKRDREERKGW